jgi:DDE family transposase
MPDSTPSACFQATDDWADFTSHGLLVVAHDFAVRVGFFSALEHSLAVRMRTRDYSWHQKFATLWASIVAGCDHTSQINDRLGAHERATAALFGLARFPDQSQVNRCLRAASPDTVAQMRRVHVRLLARHSRARRRRLWPRLANQQAVVFLDLDQRALTVSSNAFELATRGHFGRKRGGRGYQLSLAFIGGRIGEVVDEYLDAGNTPAAARVDDLLATAARLCARLAIAPSRVVVRGDAQFGTPAIIKKIEAFGFHYVFKGLSPSRARRLLDRAPDSAVFHLVDNGRAREPAWMCDLGTLTHRHGRARSADTDVAARTLVLVRHVFERPRRRPDPKQRDRAKAAGTDRVRVRKVDYFLTSLAPGQLPLDRVLPTYHDRSTIERYFYDEAYGLGARQVRTKQAAGQALFQLLVATTNNLLRWMKHSVFRNTEIEQMGICRIVHCAMQIPARIKKCGRRTLVEFPARHHVIASLVKTWAPMLPSARGA